ncbi:MAG: biosynthetic-type acetolactate synthase large subunit [Clostridiales bacterium]|nr:biosynthetic-type acetolactate synthase large subunit [Clostridiales bacterium]
MKLTGAQIIIEVLQEQGVDTVFGYPGGAVLTIYDELYKAADKIKHYITCHEQGAAHAADGYARSTGKTGVVFATSGPGATNLVTGLATANLDSTPLVAITGNVACDLIGRDSFQEVDTCGITMPITKHNFIVKNADNLAHVLRRAFAIAQSGRPGPVLIDIPKDIQTAQAEFEPGLKVEKQVSAPPSEKALKKAVDLIRKAKRPFIYLGGGVVISDASEELVAFAEKIGAPMGSSMMGLSAVANDHPLFLGMTGMHGRFAASKVLSKSDLLIAVGTRFSDRATGNISEFSKNRKVLHIDIDPAEIGKNIPAYHSFVGDVKQTLLALLKTDLKESDPDWHREVEAIKSRPDSHLGMDKNRLTPESVLEAVRQRAGDDSPVATDVGQHQMWTAQYYEFRKPRTFITSGGLGTMGFGMGSAMGAAIGSGKQTVLITSDGSFHMNMNELATAVSNKLPLVIILLDNNALGMVRQWQTMFYENRYSQTTLNRATDYVKLAEAFGAKGLRLEDKTDLDRVLDQAFAADGPVLVHTLIYNDEMVMPMIPPGGSIKDIVVKN